MAYQPFPAARGSAQSAGCGRKIEINEMFVVKSSNPLSMILGRQEDKKVVHV